MPKGEGLCEGLPAVLKSWQTRLRANAVALLRADDAAHVMLTCANALGVAAYRARIAELPESIRPGTPGFTRLTSSDLDARPSGPVERRFRWTGYPDDLRRAHAAREVLALPIPAVESPSVALVGLDAEAPVDAELRMHIDGVGWDMSDLLNRTEAFEAQFARLRRVEAADAGLPALFRALDVRDIFDRLSVITRDVLPHDVVALALFSPDRRHVHVYAQHSESRPETSANPWPPEQIEGRVYVVIDDVTHHPLERASRWAFVRRSGWRLSSTTTGWVS